MRASIDPAVFTCNRLLTLMADMRDKPGSDDSRCFTDLWLASQYALGGFVALHVQDAGLSEDVIQEVARQATANFDKYDPSRPFTAWVIGIARQRIAEMYRKRGRQPMIFSSDLVDSFTDALSQLEPEMDDRLEGLRECLSELSDRHRRVIELRYARQLSPEQIAEQVGASRTAVTTMLHRVRNALRICVSKYMESLR